MSDKCYSHNGEDWHTDYWSAYEEAIENMCPSLSIGDELVFYEGEVSYVKTQELVCGMSIIEDIQNRAYDLLGEFTDKYLDELDQQKQKELELIVCEFIEKNSSGPRFYHVLNDKKTSIILSKDDF